MLESSKALSSKVTADSPHLVLELAIDGAKAKPYYIKVDSDSDGCERSFILRR